MEYFNSALFLKQYIVSLSQGLFSTFEVMSVEELTLGANQLLKDAKRLHWNVDGQERKTNAGMWSFNKTDRGNIIICYS